MASLPDAQHRQYCKEHNAAAREYTVNVLRDLGIQSIPSVTNFLLFPLGNYPGEFADFMLKQNIILRSAPYLGQKWCRVSIGTMEDMQQFALVMKQTWKA